MSNEELHNVPAIIAKGRMISHGESLYEAMTNAWNAGMHCPRAVLFLKDDRAEQIASIQKDKSFMEWLEMAKDAIRTEVAAARKFSKVEMKEWRLKPRRQASKFLEHRGATWLARGRGQAEVVA